MTERPNKNGRVNRRPACSLDAERQFGRAVHAPLHVLAAVAHLCR